jgi:hypothetical protein
MTEPIVRVSGRSLPADGFRVHETTGSLEVERVFDVLDGRLAAYRVRGFVPRDVCARIVANFWASPDRVSRPGEGEDGVEAYFVGASHICKTTRQYLDEARAAEPAVARLYAGTINPVSVFRNAISARDGEAICVRPAQHDGFTAGDAKAVYWNNPSYYLLEPHDDYAQTKDPDQHGFEIQVARGVMAVNIYAQVPPGAGQLQVWNIVPDDDSRARLGLTYSGYPYPPEVLREYPSQVIDVETGDLCVLHGNLVHAVLRGDGAPPPRSRLLLTCFMTRKASHELIWWT